MLQTLAVVFLSAPLVFGKYMDCGANVPLCGVLTLQSGYGPGVYRGDKPRVHGLWPQVGRYGDSKCITPNSRAFDHEIYSCYRDSSVPKNQVLWFEDHEWMKHGTCAGTSDDDDFFAQVCSLAARPLRIMERACHSFKGMVAAVRALGLPVCSLDYRNAQIELCVCSAADGRWKLAPEADFPLVCGAGSSPSSQRKTPQRRRRQSNGGRCVPGKQGPRCRRNADCRGHSGCARCAKSGYCTNLPATILAEEVPATSVTTALVAMAVLAVPTGVLLVRIFQNTWHQPQEVYLAL